MGCGQSKTVDLSPADHEPKSKKLEADAKGKHVHAHAGAAGATYTAVEEADCHSHSDDAMPEPSQRTFSVALSDGSRPPSADLRFAAAGLTPASFIIARTSRVTTLEAEARLDVISAESAARTAIQHSCTSTRPPPGLPRPTTASARPTSALAPLSPLSPTSPISPTAGGDEASAKAPARRRRVVRKVVRRGAATAGAAATATSPTAADGAADGAEGPTSPPAAAPRVVKEKVLMAAETALPGPLGELVAKIKPQITAADAALLRHAAQADIDEAQAYLDRSLPAGVVWRGLRASCLAHRRKVKSEGAAKTGGGDKEADADDKE